jgi:hypothetical protein
MQIKEQIHELIEQVANGETDALKAYIELKGLSDTITQVMKEIKREAVIEADRYDGKTFQAFGATIEKRSGGGVWSFKHLPDWNDANQKKKDVEEMHKQAFKITGDVIDPETGEIMQPAEFKPNADTIAIKI